MYENDIKKLMNVFEKKEWINVCEWIEWIYESEGTNDCMPMYLRNWWKRINECIPNKLRKKRMRINDYMLNIWRNEQKRKHAYIYANEMKEWMNYELLLNWKTKLVKVWNWPVLLVC